MLSSIAIHKYNGNQQYMVAENWLEKLTTISRLVTEPPTYNVGKEKKRKNLNYLLTGQHPN